MAQGLGSGRFYMDRAMLPTLEMAKTFSTFNGEKVGTFTTAADLDMVMTDLFIELIKGSKDLEKLDEYLEELKAYGPDEVIGVYQARCDRFKGE